MQSAQTKRIANLLGALAIATGDEMRGAVHDAIGQGPEAAAALVTVANYPDRSIEFLRQALGRSHSATVRLVDRLQRDGLIRRGRDADARARSLRLTAQGERLLRELRAARERRLLDLVAALEPRERLEASRLLERLLAATTTDRGSAWRICRLCDERACERGARCPVDKAILG